MSMTAIQQPEQVLRTSTLIIGLRENDGAALPDPIQPSAPWVDQPFTSGLRIVVRNVAGLAERRPDLTGMNGQMWKHGNGVEFHMSNGEVLKPGDIWWSRCH
jgi:hypothetical protein